MCKMGLSGYFEGFFLEGLCDGVSPSTLCTSTWKYLFMENLKCEVCGIEYHDYKSYFACRTSHLSKLTTEKPLTHEDVVRQYYGNPQSIEKGMEAVGHEVAVFRGRIDLILRDSYGRLCLVDVTKGKNRKDKVEQLRRYAKNIKWLANNVFKCDVKEPIRLFVITFTKGVEEVS